MNEAEKIYPKIKKYLTGKIVDIGCGDQKVTEDALGVDRVNHPCVNLCTDDICELYADPFIASKIPFDTVFSSHCLERLRDDYRAISSWIRLIKVGGTIILYLPDARKYDNISNPEHLHSYEFQVFLRWIEEFNGIKVAECGEDFGEDRYSFFVVLEKL